MSEPLLNIKPASNSPVLFHTLDVLLTSILIFLIINLLSRTGMDMATKGPLKLSPPVLTSIAFCILELIVLITVKICLKTAKDGQDSYFSIGFILYVVELIFFIIESSTFYNQKEFNSNSLKVYHVIEVLLRLGALMVLL